MIMYPLNDILHIQQKEPLFKISVEIKSLLKTLEGLLIVPNYDTICPVKHVHRGLKRGTGTGSSTGSGRHDKNERNEKFSRNEPKELDWVKQEVIKVKPTTFVAKSTPIDTLMNEIRTSLNKISTKNFEAQKDNIITLVTQSIEIDNGIGSDGGDTAVQKVANFVFQIASTNKFYGEVYADLYQELILHCEIFGTILSNYVLLYKTTIESINYKDPNTDYDNYCAYIKGNDKRRATAIFIALLCNRKVIRMETVVDTIQHCQSTCMKLLTESGKSNECEEIVELNFILVTTIAKGISGSGVCASISSFHTFLLTRKSKDEVFVSLTSRMIFKCRDLADWILKNQ